MSKVVDERVVEMRFDNKQFEANVQTSMSTLDKLKQSLNLTGASKGLENVSAAAKNCDVSGIGSAIESVRVKFSALEVMGVTALANITNSAVNVGKRFTESFTIEPIKTGFQEYELKMGSVQTIMASTGKSLQTVNKYLDELNEYSDKTIYSFSDMTNNIGKFTNAGVKLEDAVLAIKGISNEAAVSGANAGEASRAMYNFAQALSAGYVKLIDWKSIENANMATVEFKNELLKAAEAAGTVEKTSDGMYRVLTQNNQGSTMDDTIDATRNFNDSLSYQWMTTEVLVSTLKDYADETTEIGKKAYSSAQDVKTFSMMMDTLKEAAQSGWAQTWEIVVGDFEEAKVLWTELSGVFGNIIGASADARNTLLDGALSSSWEQLNKKIADAGIETDDFQEKLKETAREHGIAIDEMIEEEGSLANVIQKGKISGDLIIETIKKFAGVSSEAAGATSQATGNLEEFQDVVNRVIRGEFGVGEARIKALTEAGYDYATVQSLVNEALGSGVRHLSSLTEEQMKNADELSGLSEEQLKNKGYTEEQIIAIKDLAEQAGKAGSPINKLIADMEKPSGRELLIDSFRNALQGLIKIISSVKGAWREIFPPATSEQLYNICVVLHDFSERLVMSGENAGKLKRTFKGLFAVLNIISTFLGGTLKFGFKMVNQILGMFDLNILDVTASMGDAIVKVRDWLDENNIFAKGLEKLVNGVKSGGQTVRGWINEFKSIPAVQQGINGLQSAFSTIHANMPKYFSAIKEGVHGFIENIKSMDSISFDGIKQALSDFIANLTGDFSDIGDPLSNLKEAVGQFAEAVKNSFGNIGKVFDAFKDKISGIVEFIKDKFSNIGVGNILIVALGGGMIAAALKIAKILKNITSPIKSIQDVLGGLEDVLSAYAKKVKAEALFTIAKAIAVLAGSVAVLASLDPAKMLLAVVALGALGGGLIAFFKVMDRVAGENAEKVGDMIKNMSQGIRDLALAIAIVSALDASGITTAILAIDSLMLVFAGMIALSKFAGENADKAGTMIESMCKGVRKVALAIALISKLKPEGTILGILAIDSLMLVFAGMVAVSKFAGENADKAGTMIESMCKGVRKLALAIALISKLKPEGVKTAILAIDSLMLVFAGMVLLSKFAGENADKAGTMIEKMCVGVLALSVAIALISKLKPGEVKTAILAIDSLMLVFVGMIAASKLAGKNANEAGTMLLMMSGAILALSVSIALLSMLKPEGVAVGVAAIDALMLGFAAVIAATKLAKDCKSTLLIITATIGILAITLGALSMIDSRSLATASASISSVMAMFALMVASTHFAKKEAIKPILVMTAVVAALGVILHLLSGLPVESTLATAASLSVLLLSLSGACVILGEAGKAGKAAFIGIGALVVLIAAVGTLMAAIGALVTEFPQVEQWLDAGLPVLEKIGYALGSFFGNIVGGFAAGATSGLPEIGKNLSMFMLQAMPFFTTLKTLDPSVMQSAKNLAEMLLIITGAELLNSLTSWLTGSSSMSKFGEGLSEFGTAIKRYGDNVKGLDSDAIAVSVFAGKQLAGLQDAFPNSGGLLAVFAGDNTWSKFGEGLVAFGVALKLYSVIVKGLDSDAITVSVFSGKQLAGLEAVFPNTGGLLSIFAGDNTWTGFSEGLAEFGTALKQYSDNVKGIDSDAIAVSVSSAKSLAGLKEVIPNDGGLVSIFAGDNKWSTFGEGLSEFGTALKEYSDNVIGVNSDAIAVSVSSAKSLAGLKEVIPNDGGIVSIFTGDNKWSIFGEGLSEFGTALKEYGDNVKGMDSDAIAVSVVAGKRLAGLQDAFPNSGGIFDIFTGSNDWSSFGEGLVEFGTALKDYGNNVAGLEVDAINGSVTATNKLAEMAKGLIGIDTSSTGAFAQALNKLGETGVGKFVKAFKDSSDKVKSAISAMMGYVSSEISSKQPECANKMQTFVDTLTKVVRDEYADFKQAGSYLVDGLVKGINDNIYKAEAAGRRLAKETSDGAKKGFDEHSPSKVFYRIGDYAGLGLVNALNDYDPIAYKAGYGMAESAKNGLSKAISKVGTIFDGNMDFQPTIRPVLDLSDVEAGSGMINQMLDTQHSITTMANLNSISRMMSQNQNGRNDDVVAAIGSLKKQISGMKRNSYVVNGITYDDGSNVAGAVKSLIRAAKVARRV